MHPKFKAVAFITMALTTLSHTKALSEEGYPLSLNIEVGAEYDNNITVDALDLTSQQRDSSALFDGSIAYDIINGQDSSFKVGYNFSQSLHFDLDEFDLQTHGVTVEGTTKVQDIDIGFSYSFYDINLGAESFLQMHIIRPSFTTMLTQKVLMIGNYEFMKQDFQQINLEIRNSDRHSVGLKTYFLLGNGRTINVGYKLSKSNAVADALDYWGHVFDVGFKLPLAVIDGLKFTARYRYNHKNYTNITPILDEKRLDKRHSIRGAFEIPFMDQFTARLQYEYTDSTSNLQSLNYSNHLISLRLGWEI